MSTDWWAARLGRAAPPPQARQGMVQPQQAPAPAPPQQSHPQVPAAYAQPTVPHVNPNAMSEAQIMQLVREGKLDKMHVIGLAAQKGGKGTKIETDLCPECGSSQYFQRKSESKMGAAPAPYCHTCGYNGKFEQYGAMDVVGEPPQ